MHKRKRTRTRWKRAAKWKRNMNPIFKIFLKDFHRRSKQWKLIAFCVCARARRNCKTKCQVAIIDREPENRVTCPFRRIDLWGVGFYLIVAGSWFRAHNDFLVKFWIMNCFCIYIYQTRAPQVNNENFILINAQTNLF